MNKGRALLNFAKIGFIVTGFSAAFAIVVGVLILAAVNRLS